MAPVTSATDDPPVCDDDLHLYIMSFSRDLPVYELKIVAQTYKVGLSAGMAQKAVVKTFPITNAMAILVKGNSRDDNQIGFIGSMIDPGGTRFMYAESSCAEVGQPIDLAQNHLMAADGRVEHLLARL